MTREGTLLEKEPGLKINFQGSEHDYVRCVIADTVDPSRHLNCRVIDQTELPVEIGQLLKLEVIKVITERRTGTVYFDCYLAK